VLVADCATVLANLVVLLERDVTCVDCERRSTCILPRVNRKRAATIAYTAGLAQGLVGVAFPASALVLRSAGLGDARYGSIFVPQMALAALGAASSGAVLERLGARRGLALGTLLMGLSQAALALCPFVGPGGVYPLALLGTSLLGAGAGISAGPLNAYPQVLFPTRSESAVVALHAVTGGGLALTPLLVGKAIEARLWLAFPLLLFAGHVALWLAIERAALPPAEPPRRSGPLRRPTDSRALWVFVAIAFLYGLAECTFGNWGVVFLTEDRRLGAAMAGAGAAAFWAALSVGRVAVATLLLRLPPSPVLPALAALMVLGCLLVPLAGSPESAVGLFALAGVGCSAVLPLTLALGGRRFPDHRAWVAGALFSALVAGLGVGSFATGLLRPALGLTTIYRLAALPPAIACVLAVALARRPPATAAAPPAPPPRAARPLKRAGHRCDEPSGSAPRRRVRRSSTSRRTSGPVPMPTARAIASMTAPSTIANAARTIGRARPIWSRAIAPTIVAVTK